MTDEERDRRDSRALEPELIKNPQEKAAAEARNGFRQYDAAVGVIQSALERGLFKLRPSLILGLQREALAGISAYAGNIDRAELPLKAASMNRSARTLSQSWLRICAITSMIIGTRVRQSTWHHI